MTKPFASAARYTPVSTVLREWTAVKTDESVLKSARPLSNLTSCFCRAVLSLALISALLALFLSFDTIARAVNVTSDGETLAENKVDELIETNILKKGSPKGPEVELYSNKNNSVRLSWLVEHRGVENVSGPLRGHVSLYNRFWLHGKRVLPWRWANTNPSSADFLPAENGWNADSTCEGVGASSVKDPFTESGYFDHSTALPHFSSCLLQDDLRCPNKISTPEFEFTSGRKPYSLADAFAKITAMKKARVDNNKNKQLETKTMGTIVFLGDSTLEDVFNWAKCHLSRTKDVELLENTVKMIKLPRGERGDGDDIIRWYRSADFFIKREQDSEAITARLVLARSDVRVENRLVEHLCANADMLVVNWALHFSETNSYEFGRVMKQFLGAVKACAKAKTTIVYLTHPAQHFPDHPKGWYQGTMFSEQRHCVPFTSTVEEADWASLVVRTEVNKLQNYALVPTPWVPLTTGTFCRKDKAFDSHHVRVHYIPYFDVSASLWQWHLSREHVMLHTGKKSIDCTHLLPLPSFGTPIWDALYLAVWQESDDAAGCVPLNRMPRPGFQVGKKSCAMSDCQRSFVQNIAQVAVESIEAIGGNISANSLPIQIEAFDAL